MPTLPTHPAWIEINRTQFVKNLEEVRKAVSSKLLCLPIKANAYGHGLLPIALAAEKAGVDYLAISCLQEGEILRAGGVKAPLLLLGPVYEEQIPRLIELDLELTISSRYKADLVISTCQQMKKRAKVHLKVDTGMHRIGVRISTAYPLFHFLQKERMLDLKGVYSHLATADLPEHPVTYQQIEAFADFKSRIEGEGIIFHLANSGGTIYYPDSHFDMVRPGLLCFGQIPYGCLKPCFSLKAKVGYFKVVEAGQGIGYGHSYVTKTQSRIVTLPIGYGDGFRRSLSDRGSVLIRGKRHPIAGKICMDQCMVDIGQGEAYIGDEAVLIGKQGGEEISLNEISTLCDTIPYEILSLFNERIPRLYV